MPDAVVLALNSVLTATLAAAGGAQKGGLVSAVWLAQQTKRNVYNVAVVDFGDGGCGCLATVCCWWRRTVLSRAEAGVAHARRG